MCNSVFSKRKPDESYQIEYDAAKELTTVHLFDIMDIETLKLPKVDSKDLIYHGWMMPPVVYRDFHKKCKSFGYNLINTPAQYVACHHFEGWYPAIEGLTPKSKIIEIAEVRTMMDEVAEFMYQNDCSVIIKDYVKSLKHMWHEACFIPRDVAPMPLARIISTFMSVKEEMNDLQGNLVVRQFVNFKQIGTHDKSGMPLSKEFRSFVLKGKPIFTAKYWDQGLYVGMVPPQELIEEIANKIYVKTGNNLFTIDVAQLEDNTWTCVEVGDGQVSAIPDNEDRKEFFTKLLVE
jgi:hypothetical protein